MVALRLCMGTVKSAGKPSASLIAAAAAAAADGDEVGATYVVYCRWREGLAHRDYRNWSDLRPA